MNIMIGYLKPNFKNFSKKQKKIYKTFYCGLCKAIKKQYNYLGILSLSYEMTAFLILLYGLKKEEYRTFLGSCTISPFVPVSYVDYFRDDFSLAAHISLTIIYYEIKDNLEDIGGIKWNFINTLFRKKGKHSVDSLNLYNGYYNYNNEFEKYYNTEKKSNITFDEIIETEGNLVQILFDPLTKYQDKSTTNLLSRLSFLLGQWIFLIDACDDLSDDKKTGNFNPILLVEDYGEIVGKINSINNEVSNIINQLPLWHYTDLIDLIFVKTMKETSKKTFPKLLSANID